MTGSMSDTTSPVICCAEPVMSLDAAEIKPCSAGCSGQPCRVGLEHPKCIIELCNQDVDFHLLLCGGLFLARIAAPYARNRPRYSSACGSLLMMVSIR